MAAKRTDDNRVMAQATLPEPKVWTAADLLAEFGPVPLYRIWHDPAPGTADEAAVIEIHERTKRCCELIDGVLLEKDMGSYESYLALFLGGCLSNFVRKKKLGFVIGADGMVRFAPGLIRFPDVSYFSWDRLPGRKIPRAAIWKVVPNLAVEVISRGNTKQEMRRKLRDYFAAGVELVWYVYPLKFQVVVYTSPTRHRIVKLGEELDGGDVIPGFTLSLDELFADEPE